MFIFVDVMAPYLSMAFRDSLYCSFANFVMSRTQSYYKIAVEWDSGYFVC